MGPQVIAFVRSLRIQSQLNFFCFDDFFGKHSVLMLREDGRNVHINGACVGIHKAGVVWEV